MADKKTEPRIILERKYIVPLRKEWLKVPEYKRASKAIKALKQFIAKHMKLYDRDLRKVKIDMLLNNEIRFRGMKKPPAKIRVLAKKLDNDIVKVELVEIPKHIEFERIREKKKEAEIKKKVEERTEEKKEEKVEDKEKVSKETKEKEEASKEETLRIAERQAKELKHTSKDKKVVEHRKALSR